MPQSDVALLKKNIGRYILLDDDEQSYFSSLLVHKELSRKTFLLREGELCNTINYVQSGALRAFYIDRDGKDFTIMFAIRDWWVTDMYSFANRKPAMQHIVAIEESLVWQLPRDHFDKLVTRIPKFEKYFRIIFQNAYIREQIRVLQNLSLSAEERYDHFIDKYPQLIPHVTQKQIASYLGISPEFLSVLRKKKTGKKIS
ncbi:MAG: Crp/Fnr family transcriptional regulator [Chitinophagales bacterium]